MNIQMLLGTVIVAWLAGMVAATVALVLAIVRPLRLRLVLVLAGLGIAIGYVGFGRWIPIHNFPQIAYTWTSGNARISLASGWFFLGPLVLGVLALVTALANRRVAAGHGG